MYSIPMSNIFNEKIKGNELIIFHKPDFHTQYISIEFPFGGLSKFLVNEDLTHIIKPGTAHLLEHIVLNDINYDFFVKFMSFGAKCNGYTHLASTVFNMEMIEFDFDIFHIFLDHIFKTDIQDSILEKQKKIVSSEIDSRPSFPPLINLGLKEILKDDYEYFTVIGEKKTIREIQREELAQIKRDVYNPSQMNLVTVGPKDPKEIIYKYKDFLNSTTKNNIKLQRTKEKVNSSRGVLISNLSNQLVIVLKDEIGKSREMVKREVIANFFDFLLNGYFSKVNCQVRTHIDYFSGLGLTIISINSSRKRCPIINEIFMDPNCIINFLANDNLQIIKRKLLSQFIGILDYPDRISTKLHWLSRNNCSLEEYISMILNISFEDINRYLKYLLRNIYKKIQLK